MSRNTKFVYMKNICSVWMENLKKWFNLNWNGSILTVLKQLGMEFQKWWGITLSWVILAIRQIFKSVLPNRCFNPEPIGLVHSLEGNYPISILEIQNNDLFIYNFKNIAMFQVILHNRESVISWFDCFQFNFENSL